MKILLTGAGGMLAADLIAVLESAHELVPLTHRELNIVDSAEVSAGVSAIKPDLIINCAAYTRVDACEDNEPYAHLVNARGPENLATAAAETNAALVHISTDYVFDGRKNAPYIETDAVNPLSAYGRSKLEGEKKARATARHYIVRTQWLYGHSGGNFVKTMLRLAAERGEIRVVNDQVGSPTFTRDLATAIAELVRTEAYGTYHITNSGHTSWYAFARDIFDFSKTDVRLTPCSTEEYPLPATRPAFAPLENHHWLSLGKEPLRGYREALRAYLGVD